MIFLNLEVTPSILLVALYQFIDIFLHGYFHIRIFCVTNPFITHSEKMFHLSGLLDVELFLLF